MSPYTARDELVAYLRGIPGRNTGLSREDAQSAADHIIRVLGWTHGLAWSHSGTLGYVVVAAGRDEMLLVSHTVYPTVQQAQAFVDDWDGDGAVGAVVPVTP